MRDIWVISDTHFRHASLLNFANKNGDQVRGKLFDNIDQHDEYMIEQWNRCVKPEDIVYHLGDVVIGGAEGEKWFTENWSRLNGIKRLIVGNHDNIKFLSSGDFFDEVHMWRMFPDLGLLFSHVPVHERSAMMWGSKETGLRDKPIPLLNVHGHIHENPSPEGPYRCVCVEHTSYAPINIEELRIR